MPQQRSKGFLHTIWDYLGHVHLAAWLIGITVGLVTAYWSWVIQWGYLPIFLTGLGSFVGVTLAISAIMWLRKLLHDTSIMFGQQGPLYNLLEEYYRNKYDGKATFYHFSGTRIHEFIVALFENGYEIHLFIENPDTAHRLECDFQKERIASSIAQLKKELPTCQSKGKNPGRIKIYQSDVPLSMRAAVLDEHIALGWYVYELVTQPPDNSKKDRIAVWGHNGWGIVINERHSQFKLASEFLGDKYKKWISPVEIWSYP